MAVAEQPVAPPPVAPAQARRRSLPILAPLIAVLAGLAVGAVLIGIAGADPVAAYQDMIEGSFGSTYAFGQVVTVAVPLLIIGLGLALAFRGRVYNIGAEGQLLMGGLGSGVVAILLPVHVGILLIPLSLLAGALVGGLWGLAVALMRTRWEVSEVISSLLLNYVATFLFFYVIRSPLRDPSDSTLTGKSVQEAAKLPIVSDFSVSIGVFVALALVPIAWYVVNRTPFGFRVKTLGFNPDATRTMGASVNRLIWQIMIISGALAGLVGAIQLLGVNQRLDVTISNNYGYTAIVVALLGGLRVGGVVLAALFLGALSVGGSFMSVDQGLPYSIVLAIQGVFVVFLLLVTSLGRKS